MSRPRLAVVLSGFGVVRRGAEVMLEGWLPFLEERFEVHTYSRSGAGPGGIARRAIPRERIEPPYRASRLGRKALDTLYLDPIHVEWTSHLLASLPALVRGRYDLICHETGVWGGRLLAGLRRLTGVRLVDVAHSNSLGWEVPFARCRPDLFLVASHGFAEEIRARAPRTRVEVVPHGVDCRRFHPAVPPRPLPVRPPVVLAVGAMSAEKAPLLAVEAVARTGASLVLAGAGPLAGEVDRRGRERLGPERYRRLVLEPEEMPGLYTAADVLLSASPREAGPLAALEAMACGVPVVGTDDASRREMVNGAGILVRGRGPEAFAAALGEALGRRWGDVPRRRAEERSLERSGRRLAGLMAELVDPGGTA